MVKEKEIITLNYSRYNGFMNQMKKAEQVVKDPETQEELSSTPYSKPTPPKVIQKIRVPYDVRRREYLINPDLEDDELNELVAACTLPYEEGSKKGEIIRTANPKNVRDPFFKHSELTLELRSGSVKINPDDPIHRIFLESFKADRRVAEGGMKSGLKNAKTNWTLTRSGDEIKKKVAEVSESKKALKKLFKLDLKSMKMVLRAMGTPIDGDPTEDSLEAILYDKITVEKDRKINGSRNIDLFNKYASEPVADLQLRSIVTEAYDQAVITRASGNKYMYADTVMGTSVDKVIAFLEKSENEVIRDEIIDKTEL